MKLKGLQQESNQSDVVIVGGGIVGMAAALSLSKLDLKITLIENIEPENNTHQSYDDRTLVVNQASINFWSNIGIWHELKDSITPIKSVHVSNKGYFGSCIFKSEEFNLNQLAFIIEAKTLGLCIRDKIIQSKKINLICPATVYDFQTINDYVVVNYKLNNQATKIKTKLLLAADGIKSQIRKSLNMETKITSYDRTAIICNITPEKKHNYQAYERLTNTGPTALLPFIQNRCGLVWSVPTSQAASILSKSEDEFINIIQEQFGYRLGKFIKIGKRSSYPLYLVEVPKQVSQRTILIGNAAHGLSPVSAQGLNLAVRDIARLYDIIDETLKLGNDIGSDAMLNEYQASVELDQNQTIQYTDDLMNWFKLNVPLVNNLRSTSLIAIDRIKLIKNKIFNNVSGFRGITASLLKSKYYG